MKDTCNEFYMWNMQTNAFLEELLSSIRLRPIPWMGHQRAGLVMDKEVKMIKVLDCQPRKCRSSVLLKEGKEYSELFLTLFQRVQRIDLLQYLLTLCSDLLDDIPEFSCILTHKNKENFHFSPLIKLLKHDDQVISLLSGKIIASLIRTTPLVSSNILSLFFEWISSLCQSSDHNIQDLAVQALIDTLKDSFSRLLFWKESTYMQNLICILKNNQENLQLQYHTLLVIWLITFESKISKEINRRHSIILILVNLLKIVIKEKIIRVIYAILRNLINLAHSENLSTMLSVKLLPLTETISDKKWLDKEVIEDMEFVKSSLKANLEELATFDEYVLEIESGHLSWTPSHSSEKFWKENAFKLMNNDSLLLKKLVRLLVASKDPLVLAVATHDIGKFIQQCPNGRSYAQKLGAKQKVMELMTHSDSDVKYEALKTVRQFMSQPWYFELKAINVMWSDFLKKAIANVEQFTYESTVKLSNNTSGSDSSLTKKYAQGARKPMQERLAAIVMGAQSASSVSNGQFHLNANQNTVCTDKEAQKSQKISYLVYESDEITENRCSRVFPASMPTFIGETDMNNVHLKSELKNMFIKEKTNTNSSLPLYFPESNDLDINMIPFDLKQIIDEKNKKISILFEEGEKLSKKELKHISIIKNLRSNIKENENKITEMENKMKKMLLEIGELKEKLKCSSDNNKRLSDRLNSMTKLEIEYNSIKKERNQFEIEKNNLLKSVEDMKKNENKAEHSQYFQELEIEKAKSQSLSEALNTANANMTLLEEKSKLEIDTLRFHLQDEKNRFLDKEKKYTEEIFALEVKIEALRNNLEEAFCSVDSDAYVKLLKENEALQVQHLVVSQRWKEKEDDLCTKSATLQEENEKYIKIINEKSSEIKSLGKNVEFANKEIEKLKTELFNSKSIIERTKSLNNELTEKVLKLEETIVEINSIHNEELKKIETLLKFQYTNEIKNESKSNNNDYKSQIPKYISESDSSYKSYDLLKCNRLVDDVDSYLDNNMHKKGNLDDHSISDTSPYHMLINFKIDDNNNSNNDNNSNKKSPIDNLGRFISQERFLLPSDFSDHYNTSKVGPNIIQQLSLSVQKFKGQLMMAQNEISQITRQRDDARNECTYLIIEIEKKKELENKIQVLEEELKNINERYEQCLELLGEKSEKEEELKQDIKDMKELYTRQIEDLVTRLGS
ncbi:hypothetical protein PORY_002265 [Pneumocystis oryctolagi]|uniref:Uncharacterized protein n=1 Tax=Pneumocystis oryctolagi TaxID=42067 RepID=A0ACB7CA85_9ASCO|nr:hypothetical protein PORY_002265 [Pneumocystis oryctolagi]